MKGLIASSLLLAVVAFAAPDPQLFQQQLTPIQMRAKQAVFALLTTGKDGSAGLCTGFLIDADGEALILTAGHCCDDEETIVAIWRNTAYPVVIGAFSSKSKEHDACVLKPSKGMANMPTKFHLVPDEGGLYLGKPLAAYGYVQDVGIVQVDLLFRGIVDVVVGSNTVREMSAEGAVRLGMSGGPVVDSTGLVVGSISATSKTTERSYHTNVTDIRKAIKACREAKKCSKP